jgi:hypothetical protein
VRYRGEAVSLLDTASGFRWHADTESGLIVSGPIDGHPVQLRIDQGAEQSVDEDAAEFRVPMIAAQSRTHLAARVERTETGSMHVRASIPMGAGDPATGDSSESQDASARQRYRMDLVLDGRRDGPDARTVLASAELRTLFARDLVFP